MKIQEIKHNHSLTDLLKVTLFSMLMLAPALSVASRCLYVIVNKNAYQSYSNQYHLENANELIVGNSYTIQIDSALVNVESFNVIIEDDSINNLQTSQTPTTSEYTRFTIAGDSSYYYMSDGTNIYNYFVGSFTFIYKSGSYDNLLPYIKQYSSYSYLDNVFEYSVSQLENNQLFNWTQQTAIFTGVHAMCTNLGITNTVVPQILVYWFLLSVIYVIIDIILKTFTTLTHMLGSKKA